MLLLDLTHTSHTPARTGVQRVCRELFAALQRRTKVQPVTHDCHRGGWRLLERWEHRILAQTRPGQRRSAQWPWTARAGGRLAKALGRPLAPLPAASSGVVVPEIFSQAVAAALPSLFASGAPRVALFHDAIALRLPEFTPTKTVARFPAYLLELRKFDGIAAVSEDSRAALVDYWQWLGLPPSPPVIALPLGTRATEEARRSHTLEWTPESGSPPWVLTVGSIEGRKNHLALFDACERLWAEGERFSLQVVGLPRPETAQPALNRLAELQARGRPISFAGAVDDDALADAYARCAFTVYPSLMEGFGLPVLESLQHERPCVCSGRGALGESAQGGGCLMAETMDAASLAHAIRRLLREPETYSRLRAEAAARRFRTWADYADDLLAWMASFPAGGPGGP
jgi:glycosyltransferase involved in cell wall biosynthesis